MFVYECEYVCVLLGKEGRIMLSNTKLVFLLLHIDDSN